MPRDDDSAMQGGLEDGHQREGSAQGEAEGQEAQGGQQEQNPKPVWGREVEVGGRRVRVEDDVAQAIEQERQQMRDELNRSQQQLDEVRTSSNQQQTQSGESEGSETDSELEALWYTNPQKAANLVAERAQKAAEENLRKEYRKDKAWEQFWTSFYQANSHLKGDDDIVKMVFNQKYSDWSNLSVEEAQKRLADAASNRIIAIQRQAQSGESPQVEGGGGASEGRGKAKATAGGEDEPQTLGAVIKKRNQARRRGG